MMPLSRAHCTLCAFQQRIEEELNERNEDMSNIQSYKNELALTVFDLRYDEYCQKSAQAHQNLKNDILEKLIIVVLNRGQLDLCMIVVFVTFL